MTIALLGAGLLLGAAAAWAGDWPQWRGPNRDGMVAQSPPLAEAWPKGGPPKLWQSERLPGGDAAGFGSPVVAGGKVYAFASGDPRAPLRERTLTEAKLRRLGWIPEKPPQDLIAKIEQARVGEALAPLTGNALNEWIRKWIDSNLNEEQRKQFGDFANNRLEQKADALDLAVLDKLAGIKDKKFDTAELFDKWFADNGLSEKVEQEVVRGMPTTEKRRADIVLCVNAADGKTVWKTEYPHNHEYKFNLGAGATPCVAGGRVYVLGTACAFYCLDAATGKEIWKGEVGDNTEKRSMYCDTSISCSPLVMDGLVIVPGGPLTAFDAATGKVIWTQEKVPAWHSSPMAWEKDGRKYVLCCTDKVLFCVAAETGALVWETPGGTGKKTDQGSPVVQGDILITGSHPTAFRLSPEKAEQIWSVEGDYRATSALIHEGLVYMGYFGEDAGHLGCIDVKTGKELWWQLEVAAISSPTAVDGKILATIPKGDGYGIGLFKPTPTGVTMLTSSIFDCLNCTTPAFFDGKIVVRTRRALDCYDLTAKAMPKP